MSDRFDDAIDRAVREMLDVEPPANLRARVMAQLPASGSRLPASGFRLTASGWVVGSLAAAVLIVLAIFVARRSEPLPQAPIVARAADRHLPPERTARPTERPIRGDVVTRPAARARGADRIAAAVLPPDDSGFSDIAPLKTITPIAVAPIAPERITPAELAVRPLNTITDVQIAPLTPPDRR